jgi:hypothetical protein
MECVNIERSRHPGRSGALLEMIFVHPAQRCIVLRADETTKQPMSLPRETLHCRLTEQPGAVETATPTAQSWDSARATVTERLRMGLNRGHITTGDCEQ